MQRPALIHFFTGGWTTISAKSSTRSAHLLLPRLKITQERRLIISDNDRGCRWSSRRPERVSIRRHQQRCGPCRPRRMRNKWRKEEHRWWRWFAVPRINKRLVPQQPSPCYLRPQVCLITGRKWRSSPIWSRTHHPSHLVPVLSPSAELTRSIIRQHQQLRSSIRFDWTRCCLMTRQHFNQMIHQIPFRGSIGLFFFAI